MSQKQFFIIRFAAVLLMALLSAISAGSAPAQALADNQPLTINVSLDKTEVAIAEPIVMEISVMAPEKVQVKFPEAGETLGPFEVRKSRDTLDIPSDAGRESLRVLELESLDAGRLGIPAIEIGFVDRRGSAPIAGSQKTEPQTINIRSALEGVEDPIKDFRDIKDVVYIEPPDQATYSWLAWLGGAGGVMSLAFVAFMLVRRYQPHRSPKQWALHALDSLEQSPALGGGDAEQIYLRVTAIVRSFIEKQFDISAPRLTTREFLAEVNDDSRLATTFRSRLDEFLSAADLVKFAGFLPDRATHRVVIQQARELVESSCSETEPVGREDQTGRDYQNREAN